MIAGDPSRARNPDVSGFAERDGVRIGYEVFGEGTTTILLMPAWSIVRSRFWKAQVAYLARHFRVITFDGRGSGRSDRPVGAPMYEDTQFAADAVAVLDATGTGSAVLVALSRGATWSVQVAAEHPDRVLGLLALSPSCWFAGRGSHRTAETWDGPASDAPGWATYNRQHWLEGDYPGFLSFFFEQMYPEPHSTKQIEDCVGWGLEVAPATLADTAAGEMGLHGATSSVLDPFCALVRCPVLVVHGSDDLICAPATGRRLAELTGGRFVLLEGVGHGPMARHPVRVNRLIREFADLVSPREPRPLAPPPDPAPPGWVAARRRRRRALYLSSPIGLGHARRDMAVVDELRKIHPDLEVDWLAQHPVTAVLEAAGERIHPASHWLANESAHVEHEAGEHDLHAFQAIREMDEILVNNFMVFHEVVESEDVDLVIGDEAWDVDYFLHENPELKRFAFAWMTDFVGWLPMPDGGAREAALTADYNAEMIEQRARFARVRDRSVFVGDPEDVVTDPFGPGLPRIDEWVRENFDFAGYITGFDADEVADRDRLRHELGYLPDERVCVVTVGGSGVGGPLLRRVLDAVPIARRAMPELRFVVVTGPRIDPAVLPATAGATVVGHVPGLYRHLAASDVAVVQGGLTTTMELTAAGRPFVYVPLRHHFEQNIHVRHRLERYGAGRCLDYERATDPDVLAHAILDGIGREEVVRPVSSDGAATAARMLAELV